MDVRILTALQVEAFLSSLSVPEQMTDVARTPEPPANLDKLSREATAVLRSAAPHVPLDENEEELEGQSNDFETEDEIVARALAEAERDRDSPSILDQHISSISAVSIPPTSLSNDAMNSDHAFPSLPNHQPESLEDDGDDEQAKEMMSRLMSLSGPAQPPGNVKLPSSPKREVGKGWNLPGYDDNRDQDLESWCCKCISANRLNRTGLLADFPWLKAYAIRTRYSFA